MVEWAGANTSSWGGVEAVFAGAGYIVDEMPQLIFHGMRTATKCDDGAHRAALLLRFF
jgi:hypothetical protein